MRTGILAALALALIAGVLWFAAGGKAEPAPPPAGTGEIEYRQGTYRIRLTEQPCPFYEVREALEAEGVPPAKWAFVTEGARTHTVCWIPEGTGEILTLDQDGKGGSLPQDWFKRGQR